MRTAHDSEEAEKVGIATEIGRFAIIPEWLYDTGASGNALKLYGRLYLASSFATKELELTREEIAALYGASVDTTDRLTTELEAVGGIIVTRRATRIAGVHRNLPNRYLLKQIPPAEVAANLRLVQPVEAANPRLGKPQKCGTGSRKSAAHPSEVVKNNTHKEAPASPDAARVEDRASYPADFEAFWKAYPAATSEQRGGKRAAFKKWAALRKAKELPSLEDLLAAAERYGKTDRVRRGYIKEVSAWLNQGCWDTGEDLAPAGREDASPPRSVFRQIGPSEWVEYLPNGKQVIYETKPEGAE